MKVLFVNTNIGYGGASKMMVWVANTLAANNHNVTFLTYRDPAVQQPLSRKVILEHLPLEESSSGKKNIINTILKLRRYIKKRNFDFAVGFLSPSQLRLSLACVGLKTKLLYSQRGDPFQQSKQNFINSIISKFSFHLADFYVFQTDGAKSFYSNRIQSSSSIIPNPVVPLQRTCDREGNIERRLVNIARLDINQKRQDLLIKAFNKISDNFPNYVLEFYGDGPDKDKLEKLASGNSNIKFMGKTTDVVSVLQNATCAILSSDFEGVPNALLESMSLGVPSVSTDCSPGGAAMLIKNGYNGILVPRGDVESLADAISFIIKNPAKAEIMGHNSKEVLDIYSERIIAEKWIKLFDSFSNK